jgi:DNA-directed RNA polymerase specialized sigma24 family protein
VLSPRQNQVITLRVREDLSFKEIGTRLGCSDVAARVNYLYGVRNLQQRMAA